MIFDDLPISKIEHLIDEWIRSERNRGILKRRWLDGITYDRLAEEFDLSVRQTKNIVHKSENIILKHLHENCIEYARRFHCRRVFCILP